MNIASNTRTVSGLIEYRGLTIAAHIPVELLTLDTMSNAIAATEALRADARETDYTQEEREELNARADFLDRWIASGCQGQIPFAVNVFLFSRSGFEPAVVMNHNLDTYLDQVLAVSTIVPIEQMDAPQFALRANTNEVAELWLTDARTLRNARYAGPDVRVVDVSVSDLKALIASHQAPRIFTTAEIIA